MTASTTAAGTRPDLDMLDPPEPATAVDAWAQQIAATAGTVVNVWLAAEDAGRPERCSG